MQAWHVYAKGKISGEYCSHLMFGNTEEAARHYFASTYAKYYEFLAIEPETEHGMTVEDRVRYLLRNTTPAQSDGAGDEGSLLPEARIDRSVRPFNAEVCMREVRLACGGRDKTRKE
jgi:hypothetical protein